MYIVYNHAGVFICILYIIMHVYSYMCCHICAPWCRYVHTPMGVFTYLCGYMYIHISVVIVVQCAWWCRYVHASMGVFTYLCVYTYIQICVVIYVHGDVYVFTHQWVCLHIYACTCVYLMVCISMSIHVCVCVYINAYINLYIHMYVIMHVCTYTFMSVFACVSLLRRCRALWREYRTVCGYKESFFADIQGSFEETLGSFEHTRKNNLVRLAASQFQQDLLLFLYFICNFQKNDTQTNFFNEQGITCVHIYICIYNHIYLYIYMYVYFPFSTNKQSHILYQSAREPWIWIIPTWKKNQIIFSQTRNYIYIHTTVCVRERDR